MSLPIDYPRPVETNKLIEAAHAADLPEQTSLALLKLALHTHDGDAEDDDAQNTDRSPSAFHLLFAAFTVQVPMWPHRGRPFDLPPRERTALSLVRHLAPSRHPSARVV